MKIQDLFKSRVRQLKDEELVEPKVGFWGDMSISTEDSLQNARKNGQLKIALAAVNARDGKIKPSTRLLQFQKGSEEYSEFLRENKGRIVSRTADQN